METGEEIEKELWKSEPSKEKRDDQTGNVERELDPVISEHG